MLPFARFCFCCCFCIRLRTNDVIRLDRSATKKTFWESTDQPCFEKALVKLFRSVCRTLTNYVKDLFTTIIMACRYLFQQTYLHHRCLIESSMHLCCSKNLGRHRIRYLLFGQKFTPSFTAFDRSRIDQVRGFLKHLENCSKNGCKFWIYNFF